MALLSLKLSLLKLSLFGGMLITVAFVLWNIPGIMFTTDKEADSYIIQRSAVPRQQPNETFINFRPSNGDAQNKQGNENKFLMAFSYWEQLTMATGSLIHLTALAAQSGRRVVIPFVEDSKFYGTSKQRQNISLYYDVLKLNRTLQFTGHATLVSWKEFRDVCKDRLDVLVSFHYGFKKAGTFNDTTAVFPCRSSHAVHEFKVETMTCVYAAALHSVEIFEAAIAREHPCVGILQWRGNAYQDKSTRAQFNLTSAVTRPLSFHHEDFFSEKLKHIAQDFIARNLRPDFISVHVRAESVVYNGGGIDAVTKCMLELSHRAQITANALGLKVYLATDFSKFGSSSRPASLRNKAKLLMEILTKNLNPISFQPNHYSLFDNGAVAIVEMNILAAGKRLFVLGGGSFQGWIRAQFLKLHNNDLSLVNSTCKWI